jgi:exosortase A
MNMTALKLPAPDESPRSPAGLRLLPFVPLALALVALLWLFRETATAMVGIWSRSDTFAHGFLVPPISAWLVWRKRAELARTEIAPAPLWLLPLAGACFVWLLGDLASVQSASQAALVAMIVFAVPAVLGWSFARTIAFALIFLFFCVPIGEFLIEPMMEGTADFTVAALRLSGIPVYREGLQFVIPSGNWSVVAACSGVRYLIASVMVGTLFAYLNFHSTKRRLVFVAFAIAVPIVANWLRAYMIVMLGHLSDNKIAAGADHLLYGWIFFGVVILAMFAIGSRFVDAAPALNLAATGPAANAAAAPRSVWAAAAMVATLLAITHTFHARLQVSSAAGLPAPTLRLPEESRAAGPGRQAPTEPLTNWTPAFRHAAATASASYGAAGEARSGVGVWVGMYRDQGFERKMITSTNVLVEEGSAQWLSQPAAPVRVAAGAQEVTLRAATLRSPADPKLTPSQRLLVWRVYRIGDRYVAGDAEAMLRLALQRLAGRGDASAVLMFFAPVDEGDAAAGEQRLRSFVAEQLPALGARIDSTLNSPAAR